MPTYEPIAVETELEHVPQSAVRSLFRWSRIPRGRKSIEAKLRARRNFPSAEWISFQCGIEYIKQIAGVIRREMQLPNGFFIPDDSLFIVLTPPFEGDFPVASLRHGIREELGIHISTDEFLKMYGERKWTVGKFVNFVASRANEPLHIDSLIEDKRASRPFNKFVHWLRRFVPIVVGPPRGRHSVEVQLTARPRFAEEAWVKYGPIDEVLSILDTIQKDLSWPNHNFLPDDPLSLVTMGHDLDNQYALVELERILGIKLSAQDVQRTVEEQWTLGKFVADLRHRAAAQHGPGAPVHKRRNRPS